MKDAFSSFSGLLRDALGSSLAPADSLLEMVSENIIFEFPYAPDGYVKTLNGRTELEAYLPALAAVIRIDSMLLNRVLRQGPVFVLEFCCTGKMLNDEADYNQQYISVIELHDGKITHYRDYWNPLQLPEAL